MIKAIRDYWSRFTYSLHRNDCPVCLSRGKDRDYELILYRLNQAYLLLELPGDREPPASPNSDTGPSTRDAQPG